MNDPEELKFTINPLLEEMRINPIANNGKEGFFECESGDQLYYRTWKSSNQKKILVALHGMGAHSEYYIIVADQLINEGISIYAPDVKGHGLTPGKKGDLKDFKEVYHQLNEFITKIHEDNPDHPIYLMGLSMGGMITINYSVQYPELIKGIILIAPGVKSTFKMKASDIAIMPLLVISAPFTKGKPIINIAKRGAITSRNPLRLKYQDNDKLRNDKLSPRLLLVTGNNVRRAFKNAANITHPTLIMQGTDDKLVSPEGIHEFFEAITIEDKELYMLEGAYHSLYSDPAMEEQRGWEKLLDWIDKH